MKKCTWIGAFAALLLPLGVMADSHEEPEAPAPLTDVWLMMPKAGMQDEFEAAMMKHLAFRAEAGETRAWMAFRQVIGDNLAVVQYRSCCFEYADLDGFIAEGEKLGLGENFNENVDQYVDHYHHYLDYNDWENSHWPEGSDGPYYGATSWTWKEGVGPGPGEVRKKFSQMAKKEGWGDAGGGHNWLWLQRMGGEPTLTVVSSYDSYADMAPDEQSFFEFIAEKMGSEEDASKMFMKFGSAFKGSEYTVWVHDEDLSTPASEE